MVAEEGLKLDPFDLTLKQASEKATQGMLKDLLEGTSLGSMGFAAMLETSGLVTCKQSSLPRLPLNCVFTTCYECKYAPQGLASLRMKETLCS